MFTLPEKFAGPSSCQSARTLVAAALSALALAALPAGAQGTAGSPGSYGSGTGSAAGTGTTGGSNGTGAATGTAGASATGAKLARADLNLMNNLAQANIAEIESGKMALEKSQNAQVRRFAQQMIDEHTAALQQLRTLAQTKGVTLTDETDLQHKTRATALRVLSGETFDSQYMKRAGVSDHENTIELLQKAQTSSTDPDIKAMAARMMPTVQSHLQLARQMTQQMNGSNGSNSQNGSNESEGTSGSTNR